MSRTLLFALASPLLPALAACPPKEEPAASVVVVLPDGDCDAQHKDDAGHLAPCPFDYGTVSSAQGATQSFHIENSGNTDATITSALTFGDPSFTIEAGAPTTLAAGGSGDLVVDVRPVQPVQIKETLVVTWEPPESVIHIDLFATGDGQLQHFNANPGECNFGALAIGAHGTCNVALGNDGVASLHITSVALADNPGGIYTLAGTVPADVDVAPGASVPLEVDVTPAVTGDVVGHFLVVSDDPSNSQARITLRVTGT